MNIKAVQIGNSVENRVAVLATVRRGWRSQLCGWIATAFAFGALMIVAIQFVEPVWLWIARWWV